MPEPLRCTPEETITVGWDFSTSGVKAVAFDLAGNVVASHRLPTDLWYGLSENGELVEPGLAELNLFQMEGQARASVRGIAQRLRDVGRLDHWAVAGLSATHHTAGRIDRDRNQIRRAICWNDQTLEKFHAVGLERLGGAERVEELIGGPWAIRYGLTHLVKDEVELAAHDWRRTWLNVSHGGLAAGYLTGNFGAASVSVAASSGLMDLRTCQWNTAMLGCLENAEYRKLAEKQLPAIVDQYTPIGRLANHVALEAGIANDCRPILYPTSDDQQAGLAGGGAVDAGQVAVILGTSTVINASSADRPVAGAPLDVMRLNWGPYLWMRQYSNGGEFLNQVIGFQSSWTDDDWRTLEAQAREVAPASVRVLPFLRSEPALGVGVEQSGIRWENGEPKTPAEKYRGAIESIAYLVALGIDAHEDAGQAIRQVSVSGGLARSELLCEVLATILEVRKQARNSPAASQLECLESEEGPALGAAAAALAGYENGLRRTVGLEGYQVVDAVQSLIRYREPVKPREDWLAAYADGLQWFKGSLPK